MTHRNNRFLSLGGTLNFRHIAEADSAVLLFCSFGKDRPGIAAALLLVALEVPREVIREDYLLSAQAYQDVSAVISRLEYLSGVKNLGSYRTIIEPVLTVQSVYFEVFWDTMERLAGSGVKFLHDYLGISSSTLKTLQEKFTE